MSRAEAVYAPCGTSGLSVTLTTEIGRELVVRGAGHTSEPEAEGAARLTGNPALVANLWAYAVHESQYRRLRAAEKRKSHRAQAERHKALACVIADMAERQGESTRTGWCSACLMKGTHWSVDGWSRPLPTYLCQNCGSPTTPCAGVPCKNMANRGIRAVGTPRYCAEHRHDIPGFAKLDNRLSSLDQAGIWLEFDKRNLRRTTKIAAGGLAALGAITPMAFAAAPVIGGTVGGLTGLSGAAATSHGLALLGGGSLASGGFGMAGGAMVVAAVGGGLGSALGASVVSAYVKDDDSFAIDLLREGTGRPVILANGFLTGQEGGWGGWEHLVERAYPDSTVYRLTWGSKEIQDLAAFVGVAVGKRALHRAVIPLAKRATKKATAIPYLGPILLAGDLLKNPWHVAKARADMTGAALADLIARTDEEGFVLLGHSLGGRVMVRAAQALGTRSGSGKLHSVHLMGAAIGRKEDWRTLHSAVEQGVWNYRSINDPVLKRLYALAQGGQQAVGRTGFGSAFANIKDRDVSRHVYSHSEYFAKVKLAAP